MKEGGRERDVHPFSGPQLFLTTWKWSLMERSGTQAPDCPTHVPVGSSVRSPGTQNESRDSMAQVSTAELSDAPWEPTPLTSSSSSCSLASWSCAGGSKSSYREAKETKTMERDTGPQLPWQALPCQVSQMNRGPPSSFCA